MKHVVLASLIAAAFALPAYAADTTTTTTTTMTKTDAKPMKLKDGSAWVKVDDKSMAWVSKDDGKTWAAAPDGTWELEDGSKVTTVAGKKK